MLELKQLQVFLYIVLFYNYSNFSNMDLFEWQDRDEHTPFYIHMIAGSFAGITEHLSMIPIDNVKTHCQAANNLSITQIVRKIYNAGGLFNFYAGSSVVVAGCIPAHAIYFSIYQQAKRYLNCRPDEDYIKFAFVGALSAMFHDLIMTPAQALKQRLQLARSDNARVRARQVGKSVLQSQGLRAFYRSFMINYSMNVPFGSLIVLLNQKLKHYLGVKEGDNGFAYYLCGGLAGGIASLPTCPLDVIKTKLNTQYCEGNNCQKTVMCNMLRGKIERLSDHASVEVEFKSNRGKLWMQNREQMSTVRGSVRYRNVLDTVSKVWREQGVLGFFRGVKMRMAIQSVSSGVGWGTYQLVKDLMNRSTKF